MTTEAENRFYMNFGRYLTDRANEVADHPVRKFDNEYVRLREIDWWEIKTGCQSPIEMLLAAELMFINDGYNEMTVGDETTLDSGFGTRFFCQDEVSGFHADFSFKLIYFNKVRHTVVVECDGHDFHERTKEQAKRDRSRDRKMAADGVTVLRFTGSEIFRDPGKCAEEVQSILSKKMWAIVEDD